MRTELKKSVIHKRRAMKSLEARAVLNGKACRCYGKRLPTAGDITRHRASEASRRLFFSLDHLIRLRQHVRRDRQTDLLGGFEIDHKFKLRRLFDRQISRLGTFENPVSIICDAL